MLITRLYLQSESKNVNRYFTVQIQPDLFGRYSVIREHGSLDSNGGTVRITSGLSEAEAIENATILKEQRIAAGYVE